MVSSIVKAAPSLCTNSWSGVSTVAIRPPSVAFYRQRRATRPLPTETRRGRNLRELVVLVAPVSEVLARIPRPAACARLRQATAEHVGDAREGRPLPEEASVDARRLAGGDAESHQQNHEQKELARDEERPCLAVVHVPAR